MPGTPADLASRSLLIGKTLLGGSTYETPLPSRNLVLARNNLVGGITQRAYPLASRGLVLSKVALGGRRPVSANIHASRNLVLQRTTLGGALSGAVPFPSVVPTHLDFTPPAHITTRHSSYSGEMEVHRWADSATDAKMGLTYENISDEIGELFLAAWDKTYGIVRRLTLPPKMLNGFHPDLTAFMLTTDGNTAWHFTEVPKWAPNVCGYGTLQVNLNSQFTFTTSPVGGNTPFTSAPIPAESTSSFTDCDYVGNVTPDGIGFPGFINPTTRWRIATLYDWDTCLFSAGITTEGPGYPVDGSAAIQAVTNTTGLCIRSTGGYTGLYTVGQTYSLAAFLSGFSIYRSNTMALITNSNPGCGNPDGTLNRVELT